MPAAEWRSRMSFPWKYRQSGCRGETTWRFPAGGLVIELLEEADELARAVTVLDAGIPATGLEIDAGQQAQCAMALVFVVPREGLVRAGSWRQIGCGVADHLDAGLFVVGDDCDLRSGCIALLQDGDLAVDAEHLGHLRLECLVPTFEIVADLVRPDLLTGEYLAGRALDDAAREGSGHLPAGRIADQRG